jgi:sulfatase maturation enzyme AslB (radical SAM superfamily)
MQPRDVNDIMGCRECWVRYLCSGGCFSEKILIGREYQPLADDECVLKRLYWQFVLKLYITIEMNKMTSENEMA